MDYFDWANRKEQAKLDAKRAVTVDLVQPSTDLVRELDDRQVEGILLGSEGKIHVKETTVDTTILKQIQELWKVA